MGASATRPLAVSCCAVPSWDDDPPRFASLSRWPGRHLETSLPLRILVESASSGPSWIPCFIDPADPTARRD